MEARVTLLLVVVVGLGNTFNLETRLPVVKVGGQYVKSFFGFSVAGHRTSDGEPVILIGAPQDKNLQPGTNNSGALYRCPVTSSSSDCTQVQTDGKRHNSGPYRGIYDGRIKNLQQPTTSEIKDGQWLGVAISSQGPGGKVIVCAHRYTVRDVDKRTHKVIDSKRAMLGMCYILESDLSLPPDTNIGANNVLAVRDALHGKRLSVIPDFDNHAKYGVCQVGTSVAWTQPTNSSQDYALFGAPGCFTWRGNVFGQRTGSISKYQTTVGEDNFLKFTKHGHMGLAVTSGRFFGDNIQYVTGAPHVNRGESGTGEIYFYEPDLLSDKLQIDDSRTLSGGTFGAGYGFSLATLDANGDGGDDLLVSAPFSDNGGRGGSVYLYLNKAWTLTQHRYIEIRGSGPEGQFGLSLTRAGDINKDGFDDFAVGAPYEGAGVVYLFLGGFEGVSGLKQGQAWLKAEEVASQLIRAADFLAPGHIPVPSNLATFGSSLSGGLDLDDNDYPDLIIGAYNANTVLLLRSRPIISVTTHLEDSMLQSIDPGKAGCELDPESSHSCFHFKACFRIESEEKMLGMKIKFRIVAEPKKAVSRVWLRLADIPSDQETRSSQVDHMLLIQEGGKQDCTTIVGYVSDSQTDLQTPVQFALSYSLVQEEPEVSYNSGIPLPSIDRFPILDQQQARRTFYAKFQKNCGSDEICQAQLTVSPRLYDKERELGRSPQGAYELELGTLSGNELILDIDVQNLGEAAYEATLDIAFSTSLSYVGLGVGSEVNAPNLVNTTYLSIDLGNPFKGASEKNVNKAKIRLRFSPASVINQTLIKFDFFANTTSELVVDSSTYLHCVVVKRAELLISGRGSPEKVFYGGDVRGESAMKDVSEIGPHVDHRYLVKNYGPSMVDVLTVKINWPFQVENHKPQGKWLLYLTGHPVVKNGAGSCRLPTGFSPNPLNLNSTQSEESNSRQPKSGPENLLLPYSEVFSVHNGEKSESLTEPPEYSTGQSGRSRREVEQIVSPLRVRSEDPNDPGQLVVRLDCDRGTAKCLTVTCQIYNLKANNSFTIEIKSRLWNATLVEDYSNIDRVEILSKAAVIVDPVYTQEVSNDYKSIVTVALPDHQLEPLQTPSWWIYVVAVACGVLLLVVIILILTKIGFFKRKRPDDELDYMMSANFEKARLNGDM